MKVFKGLLVPLFVATIAWSLAGDFPRIEGWKSQGKVKAYSPSNLWEYINGAADLFLAYGFEELLVRDVQKDDLTVTVNIYDMGSALNAYGIYRIEQPNTENVLKIGGEGFLSLPYQCLLVKDRYYVKIEACEGDITESAGRDILNALNNALEGEDGLPALFSRLPSSGRIKGSEGFIKESFLGLSALKDCMFADYEMNKRNVQAFLMLIPEATGHDDVAKNSLTKWALLKDGNRDILYRKVPYRGLVGMFAAEDGFLGVSGAESEAQLKAWLQQLSGDQ